MKHIQWVTILLIVLGLAPVQGAENADNILKHIDRPVGLMHMPRGDVDLALALSERDHNCQIHLQMDDEALVHAARERLDAAGLINLRAYVDRGDLKRLLPAANSCDLIVLDDLAAEELTPALAAELRRVLHPWYGVAILGNTENPLDTQVLTNWAAGIGESVQELPDVKGLVMVKAGPLEGADNWSHMWHGPDNNAVSADTAYRLPESIQWTGKPYDATRIDLHIVANGRLFSLWNGHLMDVTFGEAVLPGEEVTLKTQGWDTLMDRPVDEQRGPLLVARATGSGVRLWQRRLSPAVWLQVSRSIVVAQRDRLLVGDGSTLLVLDQASGQERQRLEMDCGEIKWIAATDKYVAVMGGTQFSRYPERMRRMTENVPPFRSAGLLLTVMDADTLEPVWQEKRESGPDAFDPRTPAISGNRLFALTEGGEAQAFEIANGEIQWRMPTGIKNDKEVGYLWDRVSRHPIAGFAVAGLYIIGASEMDRCVVLSQQHGKPMWDLERGRGPVPPLPLHFQDYIWFGGSARDPITGEEKLKVPATLGGCGHFTAAPQGIVGQSGLTWDAIAESSVSAVPTKSACMASTFVANGLIWRITNGVWHIAEWRGFNVRAAAETGLPVAAPRLAVSAASSTPGEDVSGWTRYRADNSRSASVTTEIPDTVDLLWRTPVAERVVQDVPSGGTLLGPKVMLVPPVNAGDTVVVAGNDGVIQALDLKTGNNLWTARTGGRIQSTPTIWKDRVFVGSLDGCLYAFALEDGRQLWRLRVAPEAGRIMIFDQLASRWPVYGSPLVEKGMVYAVAGYMERLDGVWAVAADAVSGEVLWEQNQWKGPNGESLSSANLLGGTGQLSWDDQSQALSYSAGEGLPLRLSPSDGAARAAYANGQVDEMSTRDNIRAFVRTHYPGGQDIGKIASGWMMTGGSRMLIDNPGKGNAYDQQLKFFAQDLNGNGLLPVLKKEGVMLMPSWDETDAFFIFEERKKPVKVALVSKEKLLAALKAQAESKDEGLDGIGRDVEINKDELFTWSSEHSANTQPHASALTPNAALLLTDDSRSGEPRLTAYARVDGKELWHVILPAPPIYGGMAVTHNGKAIVVLRNGEVVCIGKP